MTNTGLNKFNFLKTIAPDEDNFVAEKCVDDKFWFGVIKQNSFNFKRQTKNITSCICRPFTKIPGKANIKTTSFSRSYHHINAPYGKE